MQEHPDYKYRPRRRKPRQRGMKGRGQLGAEATPLGGVGVTSGQGAGLGLNSSVLDTPEASPQSDPADGGDSEQEKPPAAPGSSSAGSCSEQLVHIKQENKSMSGVTVYEQAPAGGLLTPERSPNTDTRSVFRFPPPHLRHHLADGEGSPQGYGSASSPVMELLRRRYAPGGRYPPGPGGAYTNNTTTSDGRYCLPISPHPHHHDGTRMETLKALVATPSASDHYLQRLPGGVHRQQVDHVYQDLQPVPSHHHHHHHHPSARRGVPLYGRYDPTTPSSTGSSPATSASSSPPSDGAEFNLEQFSKVEHLDDVDRSEFDQYLISSGLGGGPEQKPRMMVGYDAYRSLQRAAQLGGTQQVTVIAPIDSDCSSSTSSSLVAHPHAGNFQQQPQEDGTNGEPASYGTRNSPYGTTGEASYGTSNSPYGTGESSPYGQTPATTMTETPSGHFTNLMNASGPPSYYHHPADSPPASTDYSSMVMANAENATDAAYAFGSPAVDYNSFDDASDPGTTQCGGYEDGAGYEHESSSNPSVSEQFTEANYGLEDTSGSVLISALTGGAPIF